MCCKSLSLIVSDSHGSKKIATRSIHVDRWMCTIGQNLQKQIKIHIFQMQYLIHFRKAFVSLKNSCLKYEFLKNEKKRKKTCLA